MRGRETSHVLSQGAESLLISPLVIVRAVNWSNVFNFCRIVVLTSFSNFLTTSSDDALHKACQQLRNKYYCDTSAEFPSQRLSFGAYLRDAYSKRQPFTKQSDTMPWLPIVVTFVRHICFLTIAVTVT